MTLTITDITTALPVILKYIVPGFLFLKIFSFLSGRNDYNGTYFTVFSAVISYFIINIVHFVKEFVELFFPVGNFPENLKFIAYIFVGVMSSFVLYGLCNTRLPRWLSSIANIPNKLAKKTVKDYTTVKFFNWATKRSINKNIWRDFIDYKKGTTFKIFLKSNHTVYEGKYHAYQEKGFDSWFILKDYTRNDFDTENKFDYREHGRPTLAAINLKEIERIELLYDNDTKIVK